VHPKPALRDQAGRPGSGQLSPTACPARPDSPPPGLPLPHSVAHCGAPWRCSYATPAAPSRAAQSNSASLGAWLSKPRPDPPDLPKPHSPRAAPVVQRRLCSEENPRTDWSLREALPLLDTIGYFGKSQGRPWAGELSEGEAIGCLPSGAPASTPNASAPGSDASTKPLWLEGQESAGQALRAVSRAA